MNSYINESLMAVIAGDRTIQPIGSRIAGHPVFETVSRFGEHLKQRPLDQPQRARLLASLWAFFEAFPTGILALTLKVCDDMSRSDPWGATEKGAHVLFADVDEFGLNNVAAGIYPSHHRMFLDFCNHLGVTREELLDQSNRVEGSEELGILVSHLYRHSSLAAGLGVHFASELVASVEFACLHNGLCAHLKAYGFESPDDPKLEFVRIHTSVEPQHLAQNCELIKFYLARGAVDANELVGAANLYLNNFRKVFVQLSALVS